MKFAVIRFPGTWSDRDCYHVLHNVLEQPVEILWHRETDLSRFDAVILPGGFSYGDYLRTGAIARFSPVMESVAAFAEAGKPVIGICNGFQVLCESHLLPGALMRNESLEFRCEWAYLRREGGSTPWADGIRDGEVIRVPISHGEGNYFADRKTLDELELKGEGGVPLLRRIGRGDTFGEPERQCAEYRGDYQCARERARHDAAPRTCRRSTRRRERW